MARWLWLVVVAALLVSCRAGEGPSAQGGSETMAFEAVKFYTEDNVKIAANFFKAEQRDAKAVILVHMLNNKKESWNDFAAKLQAKGYAVIAIDMRGHGQSQGSWKRFSPADFSKITMDIAAAKDFLYSQGANTGFLVVMGASIGANSALNYAVEDEDAKGVVLLSPGLDYRGVKTDETSLELSLPALIVAAEGDTYSADSSKTISKNAENAEIKIYEGDKHGTDMFSGTDLDALIINWLARLK